MIPKPINVPNALKDQYFTRRFIDEETINDEFRKKKFWLVATNIK